MPGLKLIVVFVKLTAESILCAFSLGFFLFCILLLFFVAELNSEEPKIYLQACDSRQSNCNHSMRSQLGGF